MKNIQLADRVFESSNEIMEAVADSFLQDESVISSNYNGQYISVHSLCEDDEDGETIEWYCDTIHHNNDGSISSVDIDC